MLSRRLFKTILIISSLALALLCSCGKKGAAKAPAQEAPSSDRYLCVTESSSDSVESPPEILPPMPPREWGEIKSSGKLRVIVMPSGEPTRLSRRMTPEDYERALLDKFAQGAGLDVEFVEAPEFKSLLSMLIEGRGDLVSASLTITPERKASVNFTKPFMHTVEHIVVSTRDRKTRSLSDLAGATGVLQPGTCYWESMKELVKEHPQIKLAEAPPGLEPESLLFRVGAGKYRFTVADDNYIESYLCYRQDIKSIYQFPGRRDLAWAVHKGSPELLKELDRFLERELPHTRERDDKGDLPEIRSRKYIRALTRNNPYCYFIHHGMPMGFEHDLVAEFAKRQGVNDVMVTPPEWNDMIPWLLSGKGDIIAATFTATEQRKSVKGIAFCQPYGSVTQMLAGRKGESAIKSLKDIKGRTVVVRRSSSYWDTMERLRESGLGFKLLAAPEEMETYEIIEKVAEGEYDLTVADDIIIDAETKVGASVKPIIPVAEPESYAWAVRAEDTQLKAAIDAFFKKERKSAFYNLTYNKYFKSGRTLGEIDRDALAHQGQNFEISPYDAIFKKYGRKYDFHWCLIAAQSYQESRFDPKAKSHLGTLGLMQLLPSTAREMGFSDVVSPDNGVHVGVKYLDKQRNRIDPQGAEERDRICFALASYNAGYGHLADARALAEELGLSSGVWFGHVEEAMRLLSNPKYASKARYGYCKSSETLAYVRNIIMRCKQYSDRADSKTRRDTVNEASKK